MSDAPSPLLHPVLDLPGIRHGFFTRQGGVSSGIYATLNGGQGSSDDPASVRENRGRMADMLGVARERFVACYQVHSPDVVVVTEPWTRASAPKADAMVTSERGLAIAVSTADCGPVLFADADAGVIGAAHAGWKGAFTGVLEATLGAMERLGATRSRTLAGGHLRQGRRGDPDEDAMRGGGDGSGLRGGRRGVETVEIRLVRVDDRVDRVIDRPMDHRDMDGREWRYLAEAGGSRGRGVADRIDRVGVPLEDHVGRLSGQNRGGWHHHRRGDQDQRGQKSKAAFHRFKPSRGCVGAARMSVPRESRDVRAPDVELDAFSVGGGRSGLWAVSTLRS